MQTLETGLARGPLLLIESAEKEGLDGRALRAASGLREEELRDPDGRVPIAKFAALWRAVIAGRSDPDLGVRFGLAMGPRQIGLVGYLALHSRDLREALERLTRFSRILGDSNRVALDLSNRSGRFSWEPDPRLLEIPQAIDWILTALLAIFRQLTARRLTPLEAHFPYEAKTSRGPLHRQVFAGGARFRQPRPALVLPRVDLELPVVEADETLGRYLEQHAESMLGSLLERSSFTRQARAAIWRQLKRGEPKLELVAAELGIAARTLQRRLRQEDSSFSTLLDGLRRELATRLLQQRELAIEEIAFLLGYSEPSAFYRAFRRWRRTSPRAFRRNAA